MNIFIIKNVIILEKVDKMKKLLKNIINIIELVEMAQISSFIDFTIRYKQIKSNINLKPVKKIELIVIKKYRRYVD